MTNVDSIHTRQHTNLVEINKVDSVDVTSPLTGHVLVTSDT